MESSRFEFHRGANREPVPAKLRYDSLPSRGQCSDISLVGSEWYRANSTIVITCDTKRLHLPCAKFLSQLIAPWTQPNVEIFLVDPQRGETSGQILRCLTKQAYATELHLTCRHWQGKTIHCFGLGSVTGGARLVGENVIRSMRRNSCSVF